MITSGTFIQTDPSITTNDVTDYGKIYRGPADDGPFSSWAFTATSGFDSASGIDQHFSNPANLQITAFKFASLRLDGDPTISTANGGTTKLALISVGDLTSGATGATFTFTGLDTVLLATEAGSIRLSDIGFLGLDQLYFYARGATSDLVLGAELTDIDLAILQAERDVQVNATATVGALGIFAGNDFLTGTGPITATDILIVDALRNVNFTTAQFPYGTNATHTLLLLAGNLMNIDITGDKSVFANATSVDVSGDTINLTGPVGDTLSFASTAPVTFSAGGGGIVGEGISLTHSGGLLTLTSASGILLHDVAGADIIDAGTFYRSVNGTITNSLAAGTTITTGTDLLATQFVSAGETIDVGGRLQSPFVSAGGDITADHVSVKDIEASNGILTAGSGGITPFVTSPDGADLQHTFNVSSVFSAAPINFNGSQFSGISTSGGRLTINASSLTFGVDGISSADFNGADAASGPGGSGGVFVVNAIGDIAVDGPISATSGRNAQDTSVGGSGGTVMLKSTSGMVTVNSDIVVSSNEMFADVSNPQPIRRSASGGLLELASGLTTGDAIIIAPEARLLGDLGNGAPGPASEISITSAGGNILIDGLVQARRGRITIAHTPMTGGAGSEIILRDGSNVVGEYITLNSADALTIGSDGVQVDIRGVTLDFSAAGDLTWSGGVSSESAEESPADVSLFAGNLLSILNDLTITRSADGATVGINITLDGRSAVEVGGALNLSVDTTGLQNGGNISVLSGGGITVTNALNVSTTGTNLDDGMNILTQAGGSITAGTIGMSTNIGTDGSVGKAASVTLDAGGDILITGLEASAGKVILAVNKDDAQTGSGANITVRAGRDIRIEQEGQGALDLRIDNSSGGSIGTGGDITVTAGRNLSADTIFALIDNSDGGMINSGGRLTFQITGNITTAGDADFIFRDSSTAVFTGGEAAILAAAPNSAINVSANNFAIGGSLNAFFDNRNSDGADGPTTIQALNNISVTGTLNVRGTVSAGGLIEAGTLSSIDVTTPGQIQVGVGGIRQFRYGINERPLEVPHTLSAARITSEGGILFGGTEPGQDAGQLTLNVSSTDFATDFLGPIDFNGGSNANGGTFTVNSSGALTVNRDVEATTGGVGNGGPDAAGGTVNLTSANGTVDVTSRVQVSSADNPSASPTPPVIRRSAQGGNISVTSNRAAAPAASPRPVAINIANTGQLLSLLDAAAPGPGGKVTILATGANTDVRVAGTVRADRGTVDIRHTGDGGRVQIDSGTTNPVSVHGDVVKAGAFGANGQLVIGSSTISADNLIRLYAPGSNGELNFIANATLSSGSRIDLAANTITIQPSVTVSIVGDAGPANIYTNNANYSGFGGSNPTNGTFSNNGANTPQPLANAPAFDGP